MVNNFSRLQPTFGSLGIRMDTLIANAVMTQKRGVALRLVYDINVAVSGLNKDLMFSRRTGLAKRTTTETLPTIPVLDSRSSVTTLRKPYNDKMHGIFKEVLELTSMPPNAQIEALAMTGFREQANAVMRQADQAQKDMKAAHLRKQKEYREGLRGTFTRSRAARKEVTEKGQKLHRANLNRWRELERQDLAVELAMQARRDQRKLDQSVAAAKDFTDEIDEFEITLQRLGKESVKESAADSMPLYGSAEELLEAIQAQVPESETLKEQGELYINKMRSKRVGEMDARKERERRRRKLLAEQAKAQQEREHRQREEAVFTALERQSEEENRLAKKLWQLKQEEAVIKENRIIREEQYAKRKAEDHEESLKREANLAAARRSEYEEEAEQQAQRWKAAKEARLREKKAKRMAFCTEVVDSLINLSEKVSKYREDTDSLVPKKQYVEWQVLFKSGESFADVSAPSEGGVEEDNKASILNNATFDDYLSCKGEWTSYSDLTPDEAVGKILHECCEASFDAPIENPPKLSFPCKVAVTGPPFSGKSSVARKLAGALGVAIIDPEKAVSDAIAHFEAILAEERAKREGAEEGAEVEAVDRSGDKLFTLGEEVAGLLREGQDVPDPILVQLIVCQVALLQQAPPADGGEEPEPPQGFVLDGFPRSLSQAKLLEKALTGLDLDLQEEKRQKSSKIVPYEDKTQVQDGSLLSGLDNVIFLDMADESLALKRAMGRRIDNETGDIYHMEFQPPPDNNPGLIERLDQYSGDSNDADQAQERMTSYASEDSPMKTWFAKFDKLLYQTDSTVEPGPLFESCLEQINKLMHAKKAAIITGEAAKAAKDAALRVQAAADAAALAQNAAQEAAAELLKAKRTEIEAREALEAGKGEPDPAAAKLLDAKTSEVCVQQLKAAQEAAAQAAQKAEEAAEASKKASEALEKCRESVSDAEVHAEAKAEAEAAAVEAAEAEASAVEAADLAKQAHVAAVDAVAEAEKIAAGEEGEAAAEEEQPEEEAAAATEEEAVEEAPKLALVPVEKELLVLLHNEFGSMEAEYTAGMKKVFNAVRSSRQAAVGHVVALKRNFIKSLEQPDNRQNLVSDFQEEYNAVDLDLRRKEEAKAELVLRAVELRDALWDLCDEKLKALKGEIGALQENSIVEGYGKQMGAFFSSMAQLEVERFKVTCATLADYNRARHGLELPEGEDAAYLVAAEEQPESVAEALGALEVPEEFVAFEETAPGLLAALKNASACLAVVHAATFGDLAAVGEEPDVQKDHCLAAIKALTTKELELAKARLSLIASRAKDYLDEVAESWAQMIAWQDDLLMKQYKGECSSVSALAAIIKDAAANEQELPYDIVLEGVELVIDESKMVIEGPAPPVRATPVEAEAPRGIFKVKHLEALAAKFQALGKAVVSVQEALGILYRLAGAGDDALPAAWVPTGEGAFDAAVKLYDPLACGYLDWREIVASLMAQAFPKILSAPPRDVADTRMALERAADAEGALAWPAFAKVPFWWEEPCEGYDRNAAAKAVWFDLLKGPADTVDVGVCLCYMAMGMDLAAGLAKVAAGLGSGDGRAEPEEFTLAMFRRAVYPLARAPDAPDRHVKPDAAALDAAFAALAAGKETVAIGALCAWGQKSASGEDVPGLLARYIAKDPFATLQA